MELLSFESCLPTPLSSRLSSGYRTASHAISLNYSAHFLYSFYRIRGKLNEKSSINKMYNFYIWAYGKDIVRLFLYTSPFSRATCSQLDGLDRERAVGLTVIPSARCEFHHPAARPWTPGGTGQARLTRPTQAEQPPRHALAGVGRNKGWLSLERYSRVTPQSALWEGVEVLVMHAGVRAGVTGSSHFHYKGKSIN